MDLANCFFGYCMFHDSPKTSGDPIENPLGADIFDSSPPIAGVIHNSGACYTAVSQSHNPTTFVVFAVVLRLLCLL